MGRHAHEMSQHAHESTQAWFGTSENENVKKGADSELAKYWFDSQDQQRKQRHHQQRGTVLDSIRNSDSNNNSLMKTSDI
jgi:hypothetical protein